MSQNTPNKWQPIAYKCLAIWGRYLGSYGSYILMEQRKAAEDGAPLTALYKKDVKRDGSGGYWVLLEDLENATVRNEIINKLAKYAAAYGVPK